MNECLCDIVAKFSDTLLVVKKILFRSFLHGQSYELNQKLIVFFIFLWTDDLKKKKKNLPLYVVSLVYIYIVFGILAMI